MGKGSAVVWDGSVWHGGGRRDISGTCTVLHATYQRLYTQPIDDYSYLLADEEYMANASLCHAFPAGCGSVLRHGEARV